MKRFCISFIAAIFSGAFTDLKATAAAHAPGSDTTFEEVGTETGKNCQFTDANGDVQNITQGDAIVANYDTAGTFTGWIKASASQVATWQDAPPMIVAAPGSKDGKKEEKKETGK